MNGNPMDTNPNNSESIIRKNILTKKEKKLKNLLFKKPKQRKRTSNKPQEQPTEEKNQLIPETKNLKISSKEVTQNIDNFMKDLQNHMEKANTEQISRQMLHDQNSLLKDHARILEENQMTLKTMLNNQQKKKTKEDYNSQRLVIAEMMKPFLSQVKEIRELFDKSKEKAMQVNNSLKKIKQERKFNVEEQEEKKFPGVLEGYVDNQNALRKKFDKAEKLSQFYKDKFKDLESFGAEQYMKNLKKFNHEIRDLEQRCKDAQDEVEKRIHGINKRYNLMLPATYVDLIEKNIKQIDFVKSKENVAKKLGGELDYKNFKIEIEDIMDELEKANLDFEISKKKTEIIVPEKLEENYAEEYIKRIQDAPGILEEIKKKIENFKASLPVFKDVPKNDKGKGSSGGGQFIQPEGTQRNELIWNRNAARQQEKADNVPTVRKRKRDKQISYIKPDYLRDLRTQPISCKADVGFRKLQPESEDYNTMFDVPEDHDLVDIKQQMGATDYDNWKKENPKTKEKQVKLRYRPVKDQMNQTQKDIGVDTFSFQESNMATDAFLKAFGKSAGRSSTDGFGKTKINNIIRDSIKHHQKEGRLKKEEEQNQELDPELNRNKDVKEIYLNDIQGDTRKMILKSEEIKEDIGAKEAVKFGLENNMDTIKNYFQKKDIPPFKDYIPHRNKDPFRNKSKTYDKSREVHVSRINSQSDLKEEEKSPTPIKKVDRKEQIDEIADTILDVLNKALGKVAENPNLGPSPKKEPSFLIPSRPKTPKDISIVESKKITPYISPREPSERIIDEGPKVDLSRFYNNLNSMNHAPRYVNETEDVIKPFDSLAEDLSMYVNQLRDTLDNDKINKSKVLDDDQDSEGEIKMSKFGKKQWIESEILRGDEIGDGDVEVNKGNNKGNDKGDDDAADGGKSSGEVSLNDFK